MTSDAPAISAAMAALIVAVAVVVAAASPWCRGAWRIALAGKAGGGGSGSAGGAPSAVVLYPATTSGGLRPGDLVIQPLAGDPAEYNWFGYSREMQPLH